MLSPPESPPQPLDKCFKVFAPAKSSLETRRLKLVCGRRSQSFTVLDKLYDNLSARAAYLLRTAFTDAEIAHQFDPEPDAFGVRAKPRCERTVRTFVARLIAARVAERCDIHDQLGIRLLSVESRCMTAADSPTFEQRRQVRRDRQNAQSAARRAKRREQWLASQAKSSAACGKVLPETDLQNASNGDSEPFQPRIEKASLVLGRKRDREGRFAAPLSQDTLDEVDAIGHAAWRDQPRAAERNFSSQPSAQPVADHPSQIEDPGLRADAEAAKASPQGVGLEDFRPLRGVGASGGESTAQALSADKQPGTPQLPAAPANMARGTPADAPSASDAAAAEVRAFILADARLGKMGEVTRPSAEMQAHASAWLAKGPAYAEPTGAWARKWRSDASKPKPAALLPTAGDALAIAAPNGVPTQEALEAAMPLGAEDFWSDGPWLEPLRACGPVELAEKRLKITQYCRRHMARLTDKGSKRARQAARRRVHEIDLMEAALREPAGTQADLDVFLGQHPWAKPLGYVDIRKKFLALQMSREVWILLAKRLEVEMDPHFVPTNFRAKAIVSPGHVLLARVGKWARAQPGWSRLDLAQRVSRC